MKGMGAAARDMSEFVGGSAVDFLMNKPFDGHGPSAEGVAVWNKVMIGVQIAALPLSFVGGPVGVIAMGASSFASFTQGDLAGAAMGGMGAFSAAKAATFAIRAESGFMSAGGAAGRGFAGTAPQPWRAANNATPGGIPGACFVAGTAIETQSGARPIESLRVGERVLTTDGDSSSEVDPLTWRKITLKMPNPECPSDILDLELLRSVNWIASTGCQPGARMWFELEEMGLRGWADVQSVNECLPIQPGRGRVVLATVTHHNTFVMEVRLKGGAEPLRPTDRHHLFSVTRNDWVPTVSLQAGEILRTADGTARITSVQPWPGVHRVFNLEVETEHSYFAGEAKVLSHNTNPCAAPLEEVLAAAATRAKNAVGPGQGGAYGTRVHTAFEAEVHTLDRGLSTEISYLNGQVVPRGTPGSVRLDVVDGPLNVPVSVFDLKTGSARLTPTRIQQIQSHIPNGENVPVLPVRP
jgi:hypothetical protein